MRPDAREVWITGLGLVSCLGDGPDEHWRALNESEPAADAAKFAPYLTHPHAAIDFAKQIEKKSDLRQMELGQRLGVYAAGAALQSARLKDKADLLARTDLIVAAGGGERDVAADEAILTDVARAENPEAVLNQKLLNDLRPTLFLGQLPNLFAGNISIVHGVTGASRTLIGEESAGVDAVRLAGARIAAGQADLTLVGGSCHGARKDWLLYISAESHALRERFAPVFERNGPSCGLALASLGAFLVVEAAAHARARAVPALARLSVVMSECSDGQVETRRAALERMWGDLAPLLRPGRVALISGATGAEPATAAERAFVAARPDIPVRASGTYLGHGVEAQFPMNIALAALSLAHGRLYRATGSLEGARPLDGPLTQVVVTGVGRERGEGMALVEAAS